MPDKIVKQTMAAYWIPQDGPFKAATPFQLSQAGLGDIVLPGQGDRTVFYGTTAFGGPLALGFERSAPGTPSTNIENYLTVFRDAVQKMRELGQCRYVQLRVHDCLGLDHPGGWAVLVHLENGQAGDTTISTPVSREYGDARIGMSTPFQPLYGFMWFAQSLTKLTTSEVNAANDIIFLSDQEGCDDCGNGYPGPDQIGYIACDAVSLGTANILYTPDGGATWAATSADPFAADEHASHLALRFLNKNQLRLIASRVTADAGNPAEIAYADVTLGDEGTTVWTAVNVGATNTETISAIAWPEFGRLYAATSGGDIYLSTNQGESFSLIYDGSTQINKIVAAPNGNVYAVGATNTLLVEKGQSGIFEVLTGPTGTDDSYSIAIAKDALWLGNGTSIFYSRNLLPNNAGQWVSSKSFGANHSVRDIHVKTVPNILGSPELRSQTLHVMVNDSVGNEGDVWLTADGGGYYQQVSPSFSNSGFNAMFFSSSDPNRGVAVGEVDTGTAMIALLSPEGGV